jgi:parallel beta-helix repeat protein
MILDRRDGPDYRYYYSPRSCEPYGNKLYNNTVDGYIEGIRLYEEASEGTVIRNNALSGWTRGGLCFYNTNGTCNQLPSGVTASHNFEAGPFGYAGDALHDYHLRRDSPLRDAGYDLTGIVATDLEGNVRPGGLSYDVGAFGYGYDFYAPIAWTHD